MKKIYCCDASRSMYEDYYARQSGGELPVFAGARTQRGHGLGNMLSSLFRRILPFVKRGAKFLAPRVLKTGMQITDDVIAGKSFKESAKERIPDAIKEASSNIDFQSGSGFRKRRVAIRRRAPVKKRRIVKTSGRKKKVSRLNNSLGL